MPTEDAGFEIVSPPFPTDRVTVPRLLNFLAELREWLYDHRDWANRALNMIPGGEGKEVIPAPLPEIPTPERFFQVALTDILSSYIGMRGIRERWDALVRVYEDDWDCKAAVMQRLQLMSAATFLLTHAFMLPEHREMQQEKMAKRLSAARRRVFKSLGIPDEYLGTTAFEAGPGGFTLSTGEGPDIDFDALFYGEPDDEEEDDATDEGGDECSMN